MWREPNVTSALPGRAHFFLLTLFFFCLLLATHVIFFPQGPHIDGDAQAYEQMALDITERGVYFGTYPGAPLSREPVYPLFLAGVYRVFGHHPRAALVIQSAVFALLLAALSAGAGRLMGRRYGIFVGVVTLLIPGIAAQAAGNILTEVLAASLLVLAFLLLRLDLSPSSKRYAYGGLVLGILALTRYAFLFFTPLYILSVLVFGKRLGVFSSIRQSCKPLALLFCSFLAPVLLWTARNCIKLDSCSPVGPKGGVEIGARADKTRFRGSQFIWYTYGAVFGDYLARQQFPAYEKAIEAHVRAIPLRFRPLPGFSEIEHGRDTKREALRLIAEHPFWYAADSIAELFDFNGPMKWHNAAETRQLFTGMRPGLPDWFKTLFILVFRLSFYAFAGFVFYAAIRFGRKTPFLFFPALAILYLNAVYMFLDAIPRYAIVVYPFYALLAVYGFYEIQMGTSMSLVNKISVSSDLLPPEGQKQKFYSPNSRTYE